MVVLVTLVLLFLMVAVMCAEGVWLAVNVGGGVGVDVLLLGEVLRVLEVVL